MIGSPSMSKSSCIENKEVKVEEHHRKLLLSKNKKHMSSECNNIKLAIRNDKSKVVCAMCKQCLVTSNHDVCVLNYVNDMNSRVNNFNANVSNTTNNKKHKPKVNKPKKVGSKERLASPKPSKHRIFLSSKGCSKHMTENLKLLINFVWKFLGTVRFGNDHVAAILGYGDLQWGNILIARVYYVEGLGQNLFSFGKVCDSDLEEKSKKKSHPPKPVPNSKQRLHLLHMDFCRPVRVESINGKRSKDKAPEDIKTFLKKITVLLQAPVIISIQPKEKEDHGDNKSMYDDYIGGQPSIALRTTSVAQAPQVLQTLTTSTTTTDTVRTPTNSSLQAADIPNTLPNVDELKPEQQHVQQQDDQAQL
ncbi:hypothetical protein Tco_0617036 [Tanacetum coccineum]